MKAGAEEKTEESSNVQGNIPSFQLVDSPSSSDEKSPVISRTKAVDLNSTLDNDSSSQKVELESKEVEPKEVESEEAPKEEQIVEEKQSEEMPEGPQLGENKELEAETSEDQIKESAEAKENVETEDTIEDIKNIQNESLKSMDENENDGTPPRKKQKGVGAPNLEEKRNEEIPEGPQLGENKEVEAETENDGTPPRKKQKVEEEKIEDRQIEENSSDEEPEEVNLPFCADQPPFY